MGAAGRDFHDFLTFFRGREAFRVCCFTAEQIPFIDQRGFPRELSGGEDIPIYAESELEALIERYDIDFVFLSYSDLPFEEVMHKASRVQAAGASFCLLGPHHTQLSSRLPVIAVTAARTGAGKSPLSRAIARHLRDGGRRVGILRHPMPYGDLLRQAVQRFATPADLDAADCTIEEREEYAPYLGLGFEVFAGVDYERILRLAEEQSDVILWDGGNNDAPFVRPGLSIVVVDALRPGHELAYYPGETNYRAADILVINKVAAAARDDVMQMRSDARRIVPGARIVEADLRLEVEDAERISGKRVLVIEDGPTLTHGMMPFGAGVVAARRHRAGEIVDVRTFAKGTIRDALERYPHIEEALPALGYSDEQCAELDATIRAAAPDVVVDASPGRVARLLDLDITTVEVSYELEQVAGPDLFEAIDAYLASAGTGG